MADWFLNPWAMIAGLLLISSPIIIHLINRLRYRRVRWAAMEFLLKAQKRVRRKMILQQLLLLLLRILVVLLIGLLVARFLGFGFQGQDTRRTFHYVLLDDTPSMADPRTNDDGSTSTALQDAKTVLIEQIARNAAQATTPQTMLLYKLSDLQNPVSIDLSEVNSAETKLRQVLNAVEPSLLHIPVNQGLKQILTELQSAQPDTALQVHILSDYRTTDWATGAEELNDLFEQIKIARAKVHLIDTAHPYRKKTDRRAPPGHDNIAILEFTPSKLAVAQYETVEFTLRVKNFGAAEVTNLRFAVLVNGDENKGRSIEIDRLPGLEERVVKVEIPFDRLPSDDRPWDRFSLASVRMETNEPGGLSVDNLRHAVVEVKERLPILVVEGRPNLRNSREGDGFYLRPVFTQVLGGYAWVNGTVADLEKPDLERYSFVLLLNLPTLSEAAVKSLEAYTQQGGGVGFFLGPDIRPAEYNRLLYRNGEGLFPLPLAEQPSPELSEEEIELRRFRIAQKKLLVREPSIRFHPALSGLYTDERGIPIKDAEELERIFGFISIRRHWPAQRLTNWRDDRRVTELYCLPNERSIADYEEAIRKISDAIPVEDPEFEKKKALLEGFRTNLRRIAVSSEPLYKLAAILDDFLADQRTANVANESALREFWANPKQSELRSQTIRLRDGVKFGDPFYVVKDYGLGRVALFTTTAGETWTDWPSASPGNATFSPIMKEFGTYLSGSGTGLNLTLGEPLNLKLAVNDYRPTANVVSWQLGPGDDRGIAPIEERTLPEQTLIATVDGLLFNFQETRLPGAYLARFTKAKSDQDDTVEYKAFALNVDSAREGDLRRATRDDIGLTAVGIPLVAADDTDWVKSLRNKQSDLSESIWLVLLIGGLLLAEQYLSTKLSFNTSEPTATAPSAALGRANQRLPGRVSSPITSPAA